ncbi:hypothetical protein Pfo_026641 [Paulownia fortunei]|nr:hypothetical protein Pfo_026641 [Paulownia fortunei]
MWWRIGCLRRSQFVNIQLLILTKYYFRASMDAFPPSTSDETSVSIGSSYSCNCASNDLAFLSTYQPPQSLLGVSG